MSQPQLNHNSIQKLGLTWKWLFTTTHTHSMSAIYQLLLTQFQPNFQVRFPGWTTTTTTLTTALTLTTSQTSHLLMTWFSWNFKGRFLGIFRTGSNCHGNICPSNICLGDICLYKKFFSCYWPNSSQTLNVGSWDHC